MRCVPALALGLLMALPASALVNDAGTINSAPPPDDPGFDNVGRRGVITAVYLGDGWVLSAAHGGTRDVSFGGVLYPYVLDSEVILSHGGSATADLQVYQIDPWPDLPSLPIRADPLPDPAQTPTDVVLIGFGWAAGAPVVNDPGPGNPCAGTSSPCGYYWDSPKLIQWATNRISSLEPDFVLGGHTTESFATAFDRDLPTSYEAQAANGDSGGAVFIQNGGIWELAGIVHAIEVRLASASLYGDHTYAADLSFYRDQILGIIRTECANEIDDDGDGYCDTATGFCSDGSTPGDPGCRDPDWSTESPQCDDGIDNDGDGDIDILDTTCGNAWQPSESPAPGCGMGAELVFVLPPLLRLRRRLRRR
jgi:hypothetical protein